MFSFDRSCRYRLLNDAMATETVGVRFVSGVGCMHELHAACHYRSGIYSVCLSNVRCISVRTALDRSMHRRHVEVDLVLFTRFLHLASDSVFCTVDDEMIDGFRVPTVIAVGSDSCVNLVNIIVVIPSLMWMLSGVGCGVVGGARPL